MTDETKEWVSQLTVDNPTWTPERIAAWVQRGWAFLGVSRESYEQEKRAIIDLVNALRKPLSSLE